MKQPIRRPNSPSERISFFIATGCYSGLSPVAPGTAGSLLAVLFLAGWTTVHPGSPGVEAALGLGVILTVIGLAATQHLLNRGVFGDQSAPGHTDPQCVVIDEFAGIAVALLGHGGNLLYLPAVFLLFRIFDVTKLYPANRLEELPGAWGVMADDLMAGLWATITLWGLRFAFHF